MKRHEFDPAVLVAGLLFLGHAVLYLLDASGAADIPSVVGAVTTGVGLVTVGITAGVTESARSRRRRCADKRAGDA
jgi:hypothetical protein